MTSLAEPERIRGAPCSTIATLFCNVLYTNLKFQSLTRGLNYGERGRLCPVPLVVRRADVFSYDITSTFW
jgi:hypothetical protein